MRKRALGPLWLPRGSRIPVRIALKPRWHRPAKVLGITTLSSVPDTVSDRTALVCISVPERSTSYRSDVVLNSQNVTSAFRV
jgi:hypothetical protein